MNRPLYARVPALAAATAAALLLSACTPASSPDDAGAFHACLDGSSLQFTGISTDAGELSCGPDEVPVSWLAAGPADDAPQVDATAKPAGPERGEKGEPGEKQYDLPIDGFFLAIGHRPNSDVFKPWIETDEIGYIKTKDGSPCTSIPGIYAAGDVADPHYRQAIIAAGSGAKAAMEAEKYLSSLK